MSRPWMPLYVGDYLADTLDLTADQHGVYLLLLMIAWRRPDGSIPNDMKSLRRALSVCISDMHGNRFNRLVPPILNRFFSLESDGNWHQKRLEKEREKAENFSKKQKQTAYKRWSNIRNNNNLVDASANADANAKEVPARAPQSQSQSQKKDSSSLRSDAAPGAATGPTRADLEKQFYDRGKQVCGKNAGGMLTSLLKSRNYDIALARGVVEMAATKQDAREYVAAAIKGSTGPPRNGAPRPGSKDDTRERTVNAIRRLTDYVETHQDDQGGSGPVDSGDAGRLPLLEPP